MPYNKISDLPEDVQDNLPKKAQEIYMAAFNSSDEEHSDWDEGRKHQYAWGAVKNAYEKKEGKWVKKD
ncbi:cation transporter [Candidatus Bathyarchaeota archaeon]|nr:cation transporter [Candidatus Bathyarchaeota archaeon]